MNFNAIALALLGSLLLGQGESRLSGRDLLKTESNATADHSNSNFTVSLEDQASPYPPPQAITLWWAFANNPDNCITNPEGDLPCGPLDVFGEDFVVSLKSGVPDASLIVPNLAANISIVYATGGVTDSLGNIRLVASKYLNQAPLDLNESINPLGQRDGFTNRGAQVSLIVKSHGEYHGDVVQLTDLYDPFCDDPIIGWKGHRNENMQLCAEIQDIAFAPEESGTKTMNRIYSNPPMPIEGTSATLRRRGDALQAIVETNVFGLQFQ